MENNRKIEDEIRFLDVLKDPVRMFGLAYPYFLVIAVIAGIFYIKNMDQISFNEAPEILLDSAQVRRAVEMKKGGIVPAIDLAKLKTPGDLVQKGKDLYDQTCASCHGTDGMGNGPAGAALNPPARNFHTTEGWTNGREFPQMFKTLQEGIIKNGMAAYEYMPVEDRVALIHYVRTFGEFPAVTDAQVQELDATYSLSKGEVRPNTIPVKLAVEKVISENKIDDKTLAGFMDYAKTSDNNKVFHKVVKDCKKVFVIFAHNRVTNLENFRTAVSSAPEDLGFSEKVVRLSDSEWENLFVFINEVINSKQA